MWDSRIGYRILTSNRNSEKITVDLNGDLSVMWISGLSRYYRILQTAEHSLYDFSGGPLLREKSRVTYILAQFSNISINEKPWGLLDILIAENIEIIEDASGNLVAKFDLSISEDFLEFKKIK